MRTTCMVPLFLLGFFVFAAAEEYPVTKNAGFISNITSPAIVKIGNAAYISTDLNSGRYYSPNG
jgi:hypothetical protein